MDDPHHVDEGEAESTRTRGLSPSRLAQLRRDMLLTPEERVRAAEETLKLDRLREVDVPRHVISFERYEDYLDYKWKLSTGGA
jgi:hypothetical protein